MKVLIADDEEFVRNVISVALRRLGHLVLEASDIPGTLSCLEANPDTDCLIVDENMKSTMTGSELSIAARDKYPKTRIVIATGNDRQTARHRADAFLFKPFSMRSLEEIIQIPDATA